MHSNEVSLGTPVAKVTLEAKSLQLPGNDVWDTEHKDRMVYEILQNWGICQRTLQIKDSNQRVVVIRAGKKSGFHPRPEHCLPESPQVSSVLVNQTITFNHCKWNRVWNYFHRVETAADGTQWK